MLEYHKKKKWCQIGVKTEKITISKEIRYCESLILKGLQKNNKNISTQPLTVLTTDAIFLVEHENKGGISINISTTLNTEFHSGGAKL